VIEPAPGDETSPFLYFAFGSNLDEARLTLHCPSARLVGAARLPDHRLAFSIESKNTWHGGVADIRPAPGDHVWGALWVIDGADSRELDDQEGVFRDPPAYGRVTVEVETPAGDRVRCRSYQVVSPDPKGFAPSPAFRETIVRGARAVGLPAEYVARLEALPDNGWPSPNPLPR
jgi:gamma-glutamylcyclotransferase